MPASKITGVTIKKQHEVDTSKVSIHSTYFLLGTLNDYINHQYASKKNQFDRYYEFEKPLMKYVDSIAKKDFNITLLEQKNAFFSEELSNKMNAFYTGTTLDAQQFNSSKIKLSFLLGVYYRYGEKINEQIYKIQLVNSPKHKAVCAFLTELNCPKIFFKRLDNIPTIYQIYFQPTAIMKKYFATIESEKEKLFNSQLDSFSSMNISKADYKKEMERESLGVIKIFEK
jgi:hypothetical protein